ncbi:MAG: glycosyltransferase family 4 protein [Candidatus Omnitrophica bacterium]|nr:glycosyltransferase family 4 protein [Candidatus Omnitrophota bacterium]
MTETKSLRSARHLFIANDFPPILGGQSSFLYHLCRALSAADIMVLAPACGDTSEFDRAQAFKIIRRPYVIRTPLLEKLVKIVLPFFFARTILAREGVAYLHCAHVLSTGFIGLAFKRLRGLNYIIYSHSADILEHRGKPWLRPWLDRILASASYIVVSNRFTAVKLQEMGIPEGKILLSWPKIDSDAFTVAADRAPVLEGLGLAGRRLILSVGRLVERKGFDKMIAAMPEILRTAPEAVYVVFGRGPDSVRLHRLVEEAGLTESVRFIQGDDATKKALLSACAIFVMVSREIRERGDTEGFGMVFLEAGACGKPVVAGDSGGVRDAVAEGESGLLVDPEDPSAVAGAVSRLLSDSALAARLGEQGKKRVRDKFDYRCGCPELDPIFRRDVHV